jgi:hypothetical protein
VSNLVSQREPERLSVYRARRRVVSWRHDKSIGVVSSFIVSIIGAVVTWAIAGDALGNVWGPIVGFGIGFAVWEFLLRPLRNYMWTFPEAEHVRLLAEKDEIESRHRRETESMATKIDVYRRSLDGVTAQVAGLQAQLAEKRHRREVVDALAERLARGQKISRQVLFDDDDLRDFRQNMRDWVKETVAEMERLGCSSWEILSVSSPPYADYQRMPEFDEYEQTHFNEHKKSMLLHLDKLGRVIDSYAEGSLLRPPS